jgi:hypothetical protein
LADFLAVGGGTSRLVRLTTAFTTGESGEITEEIARFETGGEGCFTTIGGEVEFLAIVHDEQGRTGEIFLFEAVLEFLEEGGI